MILEREYYLNYTLGKLQINDKILYTLELPYKGNQVNISCIPEGEYNVRPVVHKKLGLCFFIENVKGRTGIFIHVGNSVQDFYYIDNYKKASKWKQESSGCILVGCSYEELVDSKMRDQCLVYDSKKAIKSLYEYFRDSNDKKLIIKHE